MKVLVALTRGPGRTYNERCTLALWLLSMVTLLCCCLPVKPVQEKGAITISCTCVLVGVRPPRMNSLRGSSFNYAQCPFHTVSTCIHIGRRKRGLYTSARQLILRNRLELFRNAMHDYIILCMTGR